MNNLTKDYFESLIFESFKVDQILDSLVNKNYPEPKVKVFIEKDLIPINQLLREQLEKLILESKDNSPEVLAAKNAWDYFCRITRIVGARGNFGRPRALPKFPKRGLSPAKAIR